MYSIQKTFSNFAWIYFLSLIILGNFFLLNLNLAVLKVKFSEAHSLMKNKIYVKKKSHFLVFDLAKLKKEGIWKKNNNTVRVPKFLIDLKSCLMNINDTCIDKFHTNTTNNKLRQHNRIDFSSQQNFERISKSQNLKKEKKTYIFKSSFTSKNKKKIEKSSLNYFRKIFQYFIFYSFFTKFIK